MHDASGDNLAVLFFVDEIHVGTLTSLGRGERAALVDITHWVKDVNVMFEEVSVRGQTTKKNQFKSCECTCQAAVPATYVEEVWQRHNFVQ